MKKALIFLLSFTATSCFAHYTISDVTIKQDDQHTAHITFSIPATATDPLYKEYLTIATDNPDLKLTQWYTETPTVDLFDPSFKETKKAYVQPVEIIGILHSDTLATIADASLHITYYSSPTRKMVQTVIPLSFNPLESLATTIDIPTTQEITEPSSAKEMKELSTPEPSAKKSLLTKLTDIASNSDSSLFIRLLVIFFIGLLMSLTPCIYPMMPITAGILQSQGSSSLFTNFLLAGSYATGIATTFALLGLGAAFAGQAMGSLMSKPAFILPLIAIIIYLALSMIGLYEMYVPSFFQPRNHSIKGGSYFSAFFFGLASGIVASPCLSPGLVCLLCIVTTLGSKFLGFIMLFIFGIGLSVPLLIIGTFSGALNVLPQAGMWMVEIKKIFGYGMLGMCIYFFSYIAPAYAVMALLTMFLLAVGLIYLYEANSAHSRLWRFIKNSIGIMLIAGFVVSGVKSYQAWHSTTTHATFWHHEYQHALNLARQEHKPLFIDIGAPFCSICKAIDATIFANKRVQDALQKHTIALKLDGSDTANKAVTAHYQVLGFPTILLVDPTNETRIKQWGPELYGSDPEQFIHELEQAR